MPESHISRRDLLAGAGVGAAALAARARAVQAQPAHGAPSSSPTPRSSPSMRCRTTSPWPSKATGSRRSVRPIRSSRRYPQAEVYEGRGKALFPGLINCHAHLGRVLSRGFNEDFGFPNCYAWRCSPAACLQGEEGTLMVTVGALEAIRTGTTTIVENVGGIAAAPPELASTGIRCVFAESSATARRSPRRCRRKVSPRAKRPVSRRSCEKRACSASAICSPPGTARTRVASACSPPPRWRRTSSPELLHAVRAFAEKHDLGYTIHLSQSHAEVDYVRKHHGVRPAGVSRSSTASSARGCSPRTAATWTMPTSRCSAKSGTIVSHQAAMAANRGVIPPIPALRAAGCPIAMGTDNNTNDLFEVMRVAMLTERIRRDDAFPACCRSPKTCSRTPRSAARERCGSRRARLAGGRQEGGHPRAGHAAHPSRARRCASSRRGSTTASPRTSSRS